MVVMDYIDAQPEPPNARGQIERGLTSLHANGFVVGDLRILRNILFDADGDVKFIDFDWCGRYNMKIRDENLEDRRRKQIENMPVERVQVGDSDGAYVYYSLAMSTLEGMWARGMEPLAQIRPEHDWMIFEKMFDDDGYPW